METEQETNVLRRFVDAGGEISAQSRAILLDLALHAPPLLELMISHPQLMDGLLTWPLTESRTRESIEEAAEGRLYVNVDEVWFKSALRFLRHEQLIAIALREIRGYADIDQTSGEIADLASVLIDAALDFALTHHETRFGYPTHQNQKISIVAMGMGKLGSGELNPGSDVDLVFLYTSDDFDESSCRITPQEFFAKVVATTTKALSDVTEEGFAFRVDLRLRPEGSRGRSAHSLDAALNYYENVGRTWERAAWVRAAPIAGDRLLGHRARAMLSPFIFRKHVDPSIAERMQDMLLRSRREHRVDLEKNVKLGRGGIREAEFFVQTLQLIWGGKYADLRIGNTIEALQRIRNLGMVTEVEEENFGRAWALLRRTEHRIQARAGYQSHELPSGDALTQLASSLGYDQPHSFLRNLDRARASIAKLFDSLFQHPIDQRSHPLLSALRRQATDDEVLHEIQNALDLRDGDAALAYFKRLARPNGPLSRTNQERRPLFGPLLIHEINQTVSPERALRGISLFFSKMGSGWGFESLFVERPLLLRKLCALFSLSETLANALIGHPESVSELLSNRNAPDEQAIATAHTHLDLRDEALFLSSLRRVKRELTLSIGLAYLGDELSLGESTRRLSLLADAQIAAAYRWAAVDIQTRYQLVSTTNFAVIALGKLGSSELGFASDLDLCFLYDEDADVGEHARQDVFSRFSRVLMRILSQLNAEGPGYLVDTRLRPSGNQGLLVVPLNTFLRYHRQRADDWESLALTRARVIFAPAPFAQRCSDEIAALQRQSDIHPLRIGAIRARIRDELANETASKFHPKIGDGTLIDIEFIVQALHIRAGLQTEPGTQTTAQLDELLQAGQFTLTTHQTLSAAYEFFRDVEQTMALIQPSGSGHLRTRSSQSDMIARRLRIRARDGLNREDALFVTWAQHANNVANIFRSYFSAETNTDEK